LPVFRTYFFYQDDSPGSIPILLDFPSEWGHRFEAAWSTDLNTWATQEGKVFKPGPYRVITLPEWSHNSPDGPRPLIQAGDDRTVLQVIQGPGDASRSVTVTFENYTDAYLGLKTAHLDGGTCSDDMYPPEQIGSGTPEMAARVMWASQSHGFMTGTEGYTVYLLQDGESTIVLYWNNSIAGGNGYNVTLAEPLKDSYTGGYSGRDGGIASVTMTLKKSNFKCTYETSRSGKRNRGVGMPSC
jgi:hypothetical protein